MANLTDEQLAADEALCSNTSKISLDDLATDAEYRLSYRPDYVRRIVLGVAALPEYIAEVRRLRARIAELEAVLGRIDQWTHEMGAALVPHGPDAYGEGVRVAKEQVRRLLRATTSKEADRG